MSTISVIVPVYNAEDTLERCVGSILSQTHANLDVVLVEDGSTDISGAMCDAYAEFDQRVRAFHTPNRGLSAARNLGLDHALSSGAELIAFADADDWLEPRMFEELLDALESSGADIAQCGRRIEGMRITDDFVPSASLYDKREAAIALVKGDINNGVWNKLYRKRVCEGLRFPEGRVFEEISATPMMVLLCDKVVTIPFVGYHYVMRKGSITHTHTMGNLADHWAASVERYDFLAREIAGTLDDGLRSELAKGPATSISRTWRWAYGNGPKERARYRWLLREMQRFARRELKGTDKSSWPASLRVPLVFARSTSTIALAACYYLNQLFIWAFPKMTTIRR